MYFFFLDSYSCNKSTHLPDVVINLDFKLIVYDTRYVSRSIKCT